MTPARTEFVRPTGEFTEQPSAAVTLERPIVADGAALWRIARDSRTLDLNSPYSYLLWCRDFADTTVVARRNGEAVGFITGYRRPDRPEVLMVWQVAVDAQCRGEGLAGRMLDHLTERMRGTGVRVLETTVTPDNTASRRLFAGYAERQGAELDRAVLFAADDFPGGEGAGHLAEELHRIAPIAR
jgi:L-2,4-diaminobutyric acid acetyltransferase